MCIVLLAKRVRYVCSMAVEIYLKSGPALDDSLPTTILELEMRLDELTLTVEKLKASTDILADECRNAKSEEEAREFYEYVEDNLEILKQKESSIIQIKDRIDTIKGIVAKKSQTPEQSAGGVCDGHFI